MSEHLIPAELREHAHWVLWRHEQRNGKGTKVPLVARPPKDRGTASGMQRRFPASTTNPGTWRTFEETTTAWRASEGFFDGIGFVFTNTPFAGVDFDDCIDDAGELHPVVARYVALLDSYTEVSPSGSGLHVIIRANVPSGADKKTNRTPWGGSFECYSEGRYFTMTGRTHETARTIGDRQEQLEQIRDAIWPAQPAPVRSPSLNGRAHLDDRELLEKMFAATNGASIAALYHGDTSGHADDDSSADLALCNHLAFWTAGDANRIDSMFRGSGLMRAKWDERRGASTYGQRTINKALAGATESYDPGRPPTPQNPGASPAGGGATSTRASAVRSKRVQWAWTGYWPIGYLTCQSGETKLGKSLFAAKPISALTHGCLPGRHEGTPADVLIVAREDGRADMWKPRLVAAGANLERVRFLNIDSDWNVRDGLELVHRDLDEQGTAALLFIDAVMEHLPDPKAGEGSNSATFVRRSLRPLATLCEERALAGLISTHPPKGRAANFTDVYHGSGAFVQVSRSLIYFAYHPSDLELPADDRRRVMLRAAANIGRNPGALTFRIAEQTLTLDDGEPEGVPHVDAIEPCDVTLSALLRAERPRDESEPRTIKVDELAERIREYLADGEWHPSIHPQLLAEKFSKGTIWAARGRVARARKEPGSLGGGWEWRLHSSDTPDTSGLRESPRARARGASHNPETSGLRGVSPTNTEDPISQSSLTKPQSTNMWSNEVSKSQDLERAHAHARDSNPNQQAWEQLKQKALSPPTPNNPTPPCDRQSVPATTPEGPA